MLRGCWELDTWGTKDTHDGNYTPAEFSWAQVAVPRDHRWYRECWYERTHAGGSADFPLLVDESDDWPFVQRESKRQGKWQPGLFTYQGFDPWKGGWTDGRTGLWPVWVDNRLGAEPPPPPPPPEPPPPPPPEPEPEPDPGLPECSPACRQLAKAVDSALQGQRRVILPDGSGQVHSEGRWQFIASWMRNRLESLAVHCWQDLREGCFVPGVESTGRGVRVELESEVTP